jgi:isopentenyl-diphosphate delta-isomerase type 1
MQQQLICVNDQDQPVGICDKLAGHQRGLMHRAFSVLLYRTNEYQELELLLQKRHPQKYHSGDLWTNTCCSHPYHLENIQTAAHRRLHQELNITGVKLKHHGVIRYKLDLKNCFEHEVDHIFLGAYDSDNINFNPDEVIATQWIKYAHLRDQLQTQPEQFTQWFPKVMSHCQPYLISVSTTQGMLTQ